MCIADRLPRTNSDTHISRVSRTLTWAAWPFRPRRARASISSDGLLVKLSLRAGASLAGAIIVKHAFAALFLCGGFGLYALFVPAFFRAPSKQGLALLGLCGVLTGLMNVTFVLAFAFSPSANVLVFTALAPIWAALMSQPILGEKVRLPTALAGVAVLGGAIVIVVGIGTEFTRSFETIVGTTSAILSGILAAASLTTTRLAEVRAPDTQMVLAQAVAAIISTLLGFALIPALDRTPDAFAHGGTRALLFMLANGFIIALYLLGMTAAAGYISPTSVTLVLMLETLLGPLSTFFALGERPQLLTLVGGGVIVATVAIHELALSLQAAREADKSTARIEITEERMKSIASTSMSPRSSSASSSFADLEAAAPAVAALSHSQVQLAIARITPTR